jgi:hypothetical protein
MTQFKRWTVHCRRRLAYLILPAPDRVLVSDALANTRVWLPHVDIQARMRYAAILRAMEP